MACETAGERAMRSKGKISTMYFMRMRIKSLLKQSDGKILTKYQTGAQKVSLQWMTVRLRWLAERCCGKRKGMVTFRREPFHSEMQRQLRSARLRMAQVVAG